MKRLFLSAVVAICWLTATLSAAAQQQNVAVDFYRNIEDITYRQPDTTMTVDAVYSDTPFDIIIDAGTRATDHLIHTNYAAACLGDTLWLANAQWLANHYNGDADRLENWVPLYFTEKIAFVEYTDNEAKYYTFYNSAGEIIYPELYGDLYLIDCPNRWVVYLNEKTMSSLLAPYTDLRARYDALRSRKQPDTIRLFLLEFIERIADDPFFPYLYDF